MSRKPIAMLQDVVPTPFQLIFNAAAQLPDIINLGIGEPDLDAPPEVVEAIAKATKDGFTHYPPLNGFMDLKEAICEYWKEHHGYERAPNEVLVTAGCTQGLDIVLRAFAGPGDEVLITDPCFSSYESLIRYTGATPVMVPLRAEEEFMLNAQELEQHITPKSKILLINSPCNPTGAVYDRAAMEAIAKVVEKHDLLVISDEIYEALIFDQEHVCFATLPGMKNRTFTLGGFSKTYAMTGLRLGYVMAAAEFFPALSILSANMAMSVNSITQRGSIAALRDCQYFVDDMARIYQERAAWTVECIHRIPGVSCVPPKGTFYLLMDISKTGMSSLDFSMGLLNDTGVATIAGSAFGPSADNFVRISYNGSRDTLEDAIGKIGKYVEKVI